MMGDEKCIGYVSIERLSRYKAIICDNVYGIKSAGENEPLSPENTVFWDESFGDAKT